MDCFNYECPFRVNETSNTNRCECIACPNRCTNDVVIASDHTLTYEEIKRWPSHIEREAWEPCLFCCEKTKGRKTLAFDSAGDAVTIEIEGNKAAIESDSMGFIVKFCPECGRPLTDEAWNELEKRLRGVFI